MTSRHYRAACAVVAALIVAALGAILGHVVAPVWWTLTAAVVCGGVVAAFGLAWERRDVFEPLPWWARPDLGPVQRAERRPIHCPTVYLLNPRSA